MSAEKNESECLGTMFGSVCWFEAPSDDPKRAAKFYSDLFGWKSNPLPGSPVEYIHLATNGPDASPDGGTLKRQNPGHRGITMYIAVPSVDEAAAKAVKLGGSICVPKTEVPGMGWFIIVTDTEGNGFGLWQTAPQPK